MAIRSIHVGTVSGVRCTDSSKWMNRIGNIHTSEVNDEVADGTGGSGDRARYRLSSCKKYAGGVGVGNYYMEEDAVSRKAAGTQRMGKVECAVCKGAKVLRSAERLRER